MLFRSGSPHLYRSSSERRPATPAEVRYISPKHRLIKVESAAGCAGDPAGAACSGGRTWSPTACGGKKLLNKCGASAAEESGAGKKDKVRRPWPHSRFQSHCAHGETEAPL